VPYFAHVVNGVVDRVERIESIVMQDGHGTEQEDIGKAFLASCYPGSDPSDFVLTYYPVGQPDPYPRGCYAGIGYTWDGSTFTPPGLAE
jgi:hypothetical protein